jgi:acylaminoacyl-peptidase
VDIISTPTDAGFTGIYAITIPQRCWDVKGEKFYYNDMQKSLGQVMCVDITSGAVNIMTADTEPGTYRVFDVHNDLLIGNYSSPCVPSKIFIAKLPDVSTSKFTQNNFIEIAFNELSFSDMIKWRIIDLDRGEGSLPYQAIFVSPVTSLSPPPLIVYPHGGPLLSYKAQYIQWNACFVALGYSILIVNYNGSKGFGQDFMENLTGKVGTMDVLDVQFAAEAVVKSGEACKKYHFLYGGSYVGSIGIHLATQYPDFYKALYLRNPTFNIAALRHVSDVPEWSYSVINVPFNPAEIITTNVYSKMLDISPVANIHKINASVLLAIGMNDCRCPFSQSKELYYMMKSYGKNVKILYYPEGHPLSSIVNDGDRFINCALWFHNAIS